MSLQTEPSAQTTASRMREIAFKRREELLELNIIHIKKQILKYVEDMANRGQCYNSNAKFYTVNGTDFKPAVCTLEKWLKDEGFKVGHIIVNIEELCKKQYVEIDINFYE